MLDTGLPGRNPTNAPCWVAYLAKNIYLNIGQIDILNVLSTASFHDRLLHFAISKFAVRDVLSQLDC